MSLHPSVHPLIPHFVIHFQPFPFPHTPPSLVAPISKSLCIYWTKSLTFATLCHYTRHAYLPIFILHISANMSLAMSLHLAHQKIEETNEPLDNSLIRKALYEDDFIVVTDSGVLIRCFYFPSGSDKFIPFSDILKAEEEYAALNFSLWGFGLSGVWWASDIQRFMCTRYADRKLISLTVKGSYFKNGFTAIKGTAVLSLLKEKAGK